MFSAKYVPVKWLNKVNNSANLFLKKLIKQPLVLLNNSLLN